MPNRSHTTTEAISSNPLVAELRYASTQFSDDGWWKPDVLEEAADAIERLGERESALSMEVSKLQAERLNWLNQQSQIERLTAERDEAEKLVESLQNKLQSERTKWLDERDRLAAERDAALESERMSCEAVVRLRAALERILGLMGKRSDQLLMDAWAIARSALAAAEGSKLGHGVSGAGGAGEKKVCTCPEVCKVCGGRVAACAVLGHRPAADRDVKWHECPTQEAGRAGGAGDQWWRARGGHGHDACTVCNIEHPG